MGAWRELLDSSFSSVRFQLSEVNGDVPELMRKFGLGSYDAIHAATFMAAGLPHIATLDHGFTMLPQNRATIRTTSARVLTMRRWRGGS